MAIVTHWDAMGHSGDCPITTPSSRLQAEHKKQAASMWGGKLKQRRPAKSDANSDASREAQNSTPEDAKKAAKGCSETSTCCVAAMVGLVLLLTLLLIHLAVQRGGGRRLGLFDVE